MLKHGSLFSGIEGFGEGAKRAGIKTLFEVEKDEFCRNVCKTKYNAEQYEDIRDFNPREWRGKVDVLSGGFPCQDISTAGKQAGIIGSKSSLWSEYFRAIRETNCKYAIIENSPNLLRMGFEQILCDLSEIGYDAQWECISAAAFGMPHKRERLFVIAYPAVHGRERVLQSVERFIFAPIEASNALDSQRHPFLRFEDRVGEPPVLGMDDGFPGRSHLAPRLGAVGNSVSPIIANYLFEVIKYDYEKDYLKPKCGK